MAALTLCPVRTAVQADDDQLAELDRSTWSTLHAVLPKPVPPFEPFFGERNPPEDVLVVEAEAETEGGAARIAGYIRLVPPTPLAANAHVRQIRGLAVANWARGAGVGRTLLRASFAEARRQGANRITLRVLAHNDPARALYASEGFAVEGVLPGEFFLNGRYVDDVCMGRSLGPA
ncbi:GNAT family N-acetyltransferase [Streptomyces anulatus]|uniref:GNAT family N-acetyltransferase n=1 Tax=Streptomyces TaxID=1883 RepID=UPI000851B746|nr:MULTISPECIES: GNAT family N-acetyltransferase [unclassified Streptomyces]MBQ1107659.1 GNAT family N-acetyltransferase [Streptomyces sp. 404i]MBQ1116817.1 GNAT family N-acetyltransferase [Streptomyces sp. C3-3]